MNINNTLPSRLLKFLTNSKLVIFLFHGVIKKNPFEIRNYTNKHLHYDLFDKCMNALSKEGNPLSMDEVIRIHKNGEDYPDKSFALTFDDGFENNLSIAGPILREYKIPSTIYITSNFVDKNEMSWIDKIEYAVEYTKIKELHVPWKKKPFKLNSYSKKIFFLNQVRKYVKFQKKIEPYLFARKLCSELGSEYITNLKNQIDLKINWKQINELKKNNLIKIGGHGHNHLILSYLKKDQLYREISLCVSLLREKGKIRTQHFSYPEGLKYSYSPNVIKMLKNFNFKCSLTAIKGVNTKKIDLFHLKRIMVA